MNNACILEIKIKKLEFKYYWVSTEKESTKIAVKKSVSYLHVCIPEYILPDAFTSGKLLPVPMMCGHSYCLIWKSVANWK